jgi:hypothetical protein
MNEFYQGILSTIAFLGGLCGFIYWVFGLMEKRLEMKLDLFENRLDVIVVDVHTIAEELREERRSKDALYKFVLDNYNRKEEPYACNKNKKTSS